MQAVEIIQIEESCGIIFPQDIMNDMQLENGDSLRVSFEGNTLHLKK